MFKKKSAMQPSVAGQMMAGYNAMGKKPKEGSKAEEKTESGPFEKKEDAAMKANKRAMKK